MSIGYQISGMRVGPWALALAFFNITFGEETDTGMTPLFCVKDFVLRNTKDGGYWIDAPNKMRQKNGEYVKGDDGYTIKDYTYDIVFEEKSDGTRAPSKASLAFKRQLTEAAVAVYEQLNTKSKAPAAKPTKAAAKQTRVTEPARGTPVDEDDDLPF